MWLECNSRSSDHWYQVVKISVESRISQQKILKCYMWIHKRQKTCKLRYYICVIWFMYGEKKSTNLEFGLNYQDFLSWDLTHFHVYLGKKNYLYYHYHHWQYFYHIIFTLLPGMACMYIFRIKFSVPKKVHSLILLMHEWLLYVNKNMK